MSRLVRRSAIIGAISQKGSLIRLMSLLRAVLGILSLAEVSGRDLKMQILDCAGAHF